MKQLLGSLLVPALLLIISCGGAQKEQQVPEQTAEIVFLTNIHCNGCVNTVQNKLPNTEGVIAAKAELETKLVTVTYDPSLIDTDGLIKALNELGYDASVSTNAEEPVSVAEPDSSEVLQ